MIPEIQRILSKPVQKIIQPKYKVDESKKQKKIQQVIQKDKEEPLKKKIKLQEKQLQILNLFSSTKTETKKIVQEEQRNKFLSEFLLILNKNKIFPQKDLKLHAKTIENQIFGNFYNDAQAYHLNTFKFKSLFHKMTRLPNLSQSLVKNGFSIPLINIYLQKNEQQITELESKLSSQNKVQQQQSEKQSKNVEKNQQSIFKTLNIVSQLTKPIPKKEIFGRPKPKNTFLSSIIKEKKDEYDMFGYEQSNDQDEYNQITEFQEEKVEFSDDEDDITSSENDELQKNENEEEIQQQQSKKLGILFDPDQSDKKVIIRPEIPKGSILSLFDGQIFITNSQQVQLLSCEDITKVRKIPKIDSNQIKIQGKTTYNEFVNWYKEKYNKKLTIIGWVQTSSSNEFREIEHFSKKLLEGDKMAGCKYSQYGSLHFLHKNQLNRKELKSFVECQMKMPADINPLLQSSLFYIITLRGDRDPNIETQPDPIIVEKYKENDMMIDILEKNHKIQLKNKQIEEEKELSEITDEEIEIEEDKLSIKIDEEINYIISQIPQNQEEKIEYEKDNEIFDILKEMNQYDLEEFIAEFDDETKQKIQLMLSSGQYVDDVNRTNNTSSSQKDQEKQINPNYQQSNSTNNNYQSVYQNNLPQQHHIQLQQIQLNQQQQQSQQQQQQQLLLSQIKAQQFSSQQLQQSQTQLQLQTQQQLQQVQTPQYSTFSNQPTRYSVQQQFNNQLEPQYYQNSETIKDSQQSIQEQLFYKYSTFQLQNQQNHLQQQQLQSQFPNQYQLTQQQLLQQQQPNQHQLQQINQHPAPYQNFKHQYQFNAQFDHSKNW